MVKDEPFSKIVDYVATKMRAGSSGVSAGELEAHTGSPRSTLNRDLALLVRSERLEKFGGGRSVAYRIPEARTLSMVTAHEPVQPPHQKNGPIWSENAKSLLADLSQPLGTRKPISYQRSFVDSYTPNKSSLLPAALAAELFVAGRSKDQQPAGTYARKVLEQLLIDLSWFSSRLEGNRKSMLDTRELFEKGRSASDDKDATMLLNHKDTIEFMVEAVPTEGMTVPVVRNIQSLLMRELLADQTDLGDIRKKIVNIQDTTYIPCQVPDILLEMLEQLIEKARHIRNPVEAAFFLWVNIAYLQPFVDGNKRTSRLAANMPLMLANCAPLSFIDVEQQDYAMAMLGVYERQNVSLAVDLFEWTYKRSIEKYQVIVESMGGPDPMRVRYREQLNMAIQQVVYFGADLAHAIESQTIPETDSAFFSDLVKSELQHLEPYNCARYRVPIRKTEEWIAKGRPQ